MGGVCLCVWGNTKAPNLSTEGKRLADKPGNEKRVARKSKCVCFVYLKRVECPFVCRTENTLFNGELKR